MKKIMVIFVMSLLAGEVVFAITPGSSKAYWKPRTINSLRFSESKALDAARCRVVSYRDQDNPSYKENKSDKPDDQDNLMLVRGEFAIKGQNDMLALCQGDEGNEFLMAAWGGEAQCPSKLMVSALSRFSTKRIDYYGSTLRSMSPAETMSFIKKIYKKPLDPDKQPEGSNAQEWVMAKDELPQFEHDAVMFGGGIVVVMYCHMNKWITIYDYHNDYID